MADLASGGDPAVNIVKTLMVRYQVGTRDYTVSATDPEIITLDLPAEAPPPIRLIRRTDGAIVAEAAEPGSYQLRTAAGKALQFTVAPIPPPIEVTGPWTVKFASPGARITLKRLISWSEMEDPKVRYFSGTAIYANTLRMPARTTDSSTRLYLDLGRVEVMARVTLNGKVLDTLWKPPYRLDITDAVRAGTNSLEIQVVSLWPNRLIGDEQLGEDSRRNPDGTLQEIPEWVKEGKQSPAGRQTFTTWRLWKKGDKLLPSGLLGPVRIFSTKTLLLRTGHGTSRAF